MSDNSDSSTLPLQDDIPDLPEEDTTPAKDESPAASVSLISLNPAFKPIALVGRKTILGRNPAKCSEGGLLSGSTISGTHCEITSRSLDDMDAPLWIKDISSNGVWINEKKINRDEATKIMHKDIISFAPGAVDGQADAPAYMLVDKRTKSAFKDQQKLQAKRASDQLGLDLSTEDAGPDPKKQKSEGASLESDNNNDTKDKDKEEEDSAFEKEFECGICHEIMHKPLVLQPCLHSFCKDCCKNWLKNSHVCPSCRQSVNRTKRDFRLNNLIELFLKSRPHMARDDVADGEDGGAESDSSNVVRRGNGGEEDEEDDGYDYSDDDDDDDHDNNFRHLDPNELTCPCCDPTNTIGYICPDGVRLEPLSATATYMDFEERRQLIHPGHTRCRRCPAIIPLIPQMEPGNIIDRFQCKMCHIPNCGCGIKSVEDNIVESAPIMRLLNPAEERIINDYLAAERLPVRSVWEDIKQGMADGTYHYLGTSVAPSVFASGSSTNPASASASVSGGVASASSGQADGDGGINADAQDGNSNDNNASNDSTTTATTATAAATPAAAGPSAQPVSTRMSRAERVTASDKLCVECARDFFSNGPLYQWRKNLDRNKLPSRVLTRENCWYGRECRTQFNYANPSHAERLNHICEKRPART